MAEKVTTMVLKVDLQCPRCYKKIKKILCKFPQIRDQKFDEKANTVTITVVSCSPEKIRQKLCCKGCGVIKCIDIIVPPPPPKKEPPPPPPKKEEPPPPPPKKVEPTPPPKKVEPTPPPKKEEPPPPSKMPPPVPGYPLPYPFGVIPIGICCVPCYHEGYGGWSPCQRGHGRRAAPCYDGCSCGCGRVRPPSRCYDGCGCGCGGSRVYVNRCDQYFCEENPQACSVM